MPNIVYSGQLTGLIQVASPSDTITFGPQAYFDAMSGDVTVAGFAAIAGQIFGTAGNDRINFDHSGIGGSVTLDILGGEGEDTIGVLKAGLNVYGGNGNDRLIDYASGVTTLSGDGGDDLFFLNGIYTIVSGGDGDDTLYTGLNAPVNAIAGGAGRDTIVFGGGLWDVTFFTSSSIALNGLSSFEQMSGYVMGYGDNAVIDLRGYTGAGTLNYMGSYAADESSIALLMGSENDIIYGSAGHIETGAGNDSAANVMLLASGYYDGGAGVDDLYFGSSEEIQNLSKLKIKNFESVSIEIFAGTAGSDHIDFARLGPIEGSIWSGSLYSGDDYFRAGTLSATISGGDGRDTLIGSAWDDWLAGDDGNDTLRGEAGFDFLEGGDGNDLLNGGSGGDEMSGGTGNDTYIVDEAGDVVHENAAGGTDTVKSAVSRTLGANVEKLVLTGVLAINGSGNELANTLTGNDSANKLHGLAGKDTLSGGAGDDLLVGGAAADVLTGGTGADTFRFDRLETALAKDTIKDFEHGHDHLELTRAAFAAFAGAPAGQLDPVAFALGTAAATTQQHLI
jgi:hypothetical protein